ncbi:MAG TPA: hypothetical protein VNK82_09445 [Terriglobales bacterium]|nr:hypothetical protein [Terriglobales bacterium]
MTERRRITRIFAVLLVGCAVGWSLELRTLDSLRTGATLEEVLYISSPAVLRRMSLGYTGLMADLYWTRTVQYFGRKHVERAKRYDLLPKLLEITTSLDPHLVVAYKYGSIFLAQRPPEGAGMPDYAVKFVEEGIRNNPTDWQLYYHLGFIHYIERNDYVAASQAFLRGAEVPGAHPWMRIIGAAMAQHGGELETARRMWQYIYESSEDKYIRANAVKRLRALEVDEVVPRLEAAIQQYRQRTGQLPSGWQEMIAAGYLRGIPRDPTGAPYRLMPDGRVEVMRPDDLPFIRRGLPKGKESEFIQIVKDEKEPNEQKK